jgi:hypothetical protein
MLAQLPYLTGRDRAVVVLLGEHHTLTTAQIAAVFFGSASRARARLLVLRRLEVLDRFRYSEPGVQEWRWTLGPLGAAFLAARDDRPAPRPAAVREAALRLAARPSLPHLIAVNQLFISLLAVTRPRPDWAGSPGTPLVEAMVELGDAGLVGQRGLARWWSEARCRTVMDGLIRPDGHGVWVAEKVTDNFTGAGAGDFAGTAARRSAVPFWAEVDRGGETLRRVADKLDRYAYLVGTRSGFPVLFWLPSPVREANLRSVLARTGVPKGLIVATSAPAVGHPAGPVWAPVGVPFRVGLGELGEVTGRRLPDRWQHSGW